MSSLKPFDPYYRRLDWSPTFRCSYSCPYCFIRDSSPKKNKELVSLYGHKKVADKISCLFANYVEYIEISGGEPFILKSMSEIIDILSSSFLLGLNTNMSITSLTSLRNMPPSSLHRINCSYHLTEIGGISESTFKDCFFDLIEQGYPVRVICVAYPPIFDEIFEVFRSFHSSEVPAEFRPYRGMHDGRIYPYDYPQEHKNILCKYNQDRWFIEMLLANKPVSYQGIECNAGKYSYYLDPEGKLYRCVTDASINKNQHLGNISSMNILPRESNMCGHEHCLCPYHGNLYTNGITV